jgi:flagellar biosynthesis/type III secretory pathway M-ring protein FliF/YscJ
VAGRGLRGSGLRIGEGDLDRWMAPGLFVCWLVCCFAFVFVVVVFFFFQSAKIRVNIDEVKKYQRKILQEEQTKKTEEDTIKKTE